MTDSRLGRLSSESVTQSNASGNLGRLSVENVIQITPAVVIANNARLSVESPIQVSNPDAQIARMTVEVILHQPPKQGLGIIS